MYRWKNTVNVHWRYRWLCNPWTYVDHIYLCKQAIIYELLCISLILQHNALLLSWQLFSCLIYTAGKIISTHSTLSITSPTSPLSSCSNGPVSVWFGGGGNTVAESHTHSLAPLQERHQGGCGERGKRICPNVAHCWKQSTCIRKTLTFVLRCIMLTPPAFDFIATEALQRRLTASTLYVTLGVCMSNFAGTLLYCFLAQREIDFHYKTTTAERKTDSRKQQGATCLWENRS